MPVIKIVGALPEAATANELFVVVKEVGVIVGLEEANQYLSSNWG